MTIMMMMMIMTDPFTTNLVVKGPVVKGSVVKGATSFDTQTCNFSLTDLHFKDNPKNFDLTVENLPLEEVLTSTEFPTIITRP